MASILDGFQWYHGRIDRGTTENVLRGRRPGLFLVRDSTSCPGDFVLSVSESGKVSHYIINHRGGLYIIGDQTFHSIPEVIEFYKRHFLDTTTLIEIAPRQGVAPGSFAPSSFPPPELSPVGYPSQPYQHAQLPPFHSSQQPLPVQQQQLPPPIMQPPPMQPPAMQPLPMQPPPMQPMAMQPSPMQPSLQPRPGQPMERVRALYKFESNDPEDLPFQKGDIMVILSKDEEQWWFAQHADGRSGQIPTPYVETILDVGIKPPTRTDSVMHSNFVPKVRNASSAVPSRSSGPVRARATMDRVANAYDQAALSFKTNDIILVIKQNENGLWEGELNGRRGYFPFTHVELLEGNFSDGTA